MSIYVNRTLNMKKIKAIGLDMDHTLVRYNSKKFEQLTYSEILRKLVSRKHYPPQILGIEFNFAQAVRGLVIDKVHGNLVQIGLYGRVRQAYHGHELLAYNAMNEIYRGMVIDLNDGSNYKCIDTAFSISEAVCFQNMVDFREKNPDGKELQKKSFEEISHDILEVLDISHRDNSLKSVVLENLADYIIQEEATVQTLLRFKKDGKKLLVITNSDFHYSKKLLDYTINPFLKNGETWASLFTYVITLADKPSFFYQKRRFLRVNPQDGSMTNIDGALLPGIYQGGHSQPLEEALKVMGEEILYIGDHIYGDILQLKKYCQWRTALVMEELGDEVAALTAASALDREIEKLLLEKDRAEVDYKELLRPGDCDSALVEAKWQEIEALKKQLRQNMDLYKGHFNPYWGEFLRAGQEESRLMGQVAKYACIYMTRFSNMADYSPRQFFRPKKRCLPHEDF